MPGELHSYDQMIQDRNLLKKNLFSDNPGNAMIAKITLVGTHNSQLQKKYKLSDDQLNKISRFNKRQKHQPNHTELDSDEGNNKNAGQNSETIDEPKDKYDDELEIEYEYEKEQENKSQSRQEDTEWSLSSSDIGFVKTSRQFQDETYELDAQDNYQSRNDDSEENCEENDYCLDDYEDLNNNTKVLESNELDSVCENCGREKFDETDEYEECCLVPGFEKKKYKLSWGIPKALRLLEKLNSYTGNPDVDHIDNLKMFPDYLSTVGECLRHACVLTMGHPRFQRKIHRLMNQFAQMRKNMWEVYAYGRKSNNELMSLSELTLNKTELLDAYETEVHRLFNEVESRTGELDRTFTNTKKKLAKIATLGIYNIFDRRIKKQQYQEELENNQLTNAEEKLARLDEKCEKLEKHIQNTKDSISKRFTEADLYNESNDQLHEDKIKKSVTRFYYIAKKKLAERDLRRAEVEKKIAKRINQNNKLYRKNFLIALDGNSDSETKTEAVSSSIDAAKSIHEELQIHADPSIHVHLAMALHLLIRTIRDESNSNPFYTTQYDASKLSELITTFMNPYYDETISSEKTEFDKLELKPDTNTNKLLQRMLAVLMVFDDRTLLSVTGIKNILEGDKPELFDVNKTENKIWEKSTFKFDTNSFINLIGRCSRINSQNVKDACYKTYKEIFEDKIFSAGFSGFDRDASKQILKCFCGGAGDSEMQKIYDLLMQPELSFRNIEPYLKKVYDPNKVLDK